MLQLQIWQNGLLWLIRYLILRRQLRLLLSVSMWSFTMLTCQWLRHLNTLVWQMILPLILTGSMLMIWLPKMLLLVWLMLMVSSCLVVSVNVVLKVRFKLFVMHVKMMCQCWVSVLVCNWHVLSLLVMSFTWMALIQLSLIQTQNIQLSILCVIKLTLRIWVVLFVSVFTHVSWNQVLRLLQLMATKKLFNVVTVTVMNLILSSVNSLRLRASYSQVCHQIIVWWKL